MILFGFCFDLEQSQTAPGAHDPKAVKKQKKQRKAFEQPGLADYKKLTWHELVIQSKTSTWSAVNV